MRVVDLQRNSAALLGRYVAMPPEDQQKFRDNLDESLATAEDLIKRFPDNPSVALATRAILEAQRLRLSAGLIQPTEVEAYFNQLAESAPTPGAKSKTLFTLAVFLADTDMAKALETMKGAYDPALVYAPADLDFYGIALIDAGDLQTAGAIFDKLAADYPLPPGLAPNQAQPQVRDAQAMALFGKGRIAQQNGDVAAAGALFEQLKTNYPWSPKLLEANYGIAESLRAQKKPDEALALLTPIIRATNVKPELPAKALLLGGFLITDKMNAATDPKLKDELMANAIDYFLKVQQLYSGVPAVASRGLWEGAQLLERQAAGITDPVKKKRQTDIAIRSYSDLIREFPNSEFAPKAQERLAALQPK
jgi:tetratricopeptide (TPR) repeat protein